MKLTNHKTFGCVLVLLLTMLFAGNAYSQNIQVTGSVLDEGALPVPGATVILVGTQNGVSTDLDGQFAISAPEDATLQFSCIGYETLEVAVNGRKKLTLTMVEEKTVLDDVVVIGYGSMTRKEMTSAISHVRADELNNISSLDASMLLQGKVSGVSITNTAVADPNSSGSIQIRGVSSRNAGMAPLIVIDGVPGGDMTNINPADIESIDVLKDGAASAIYGTRGSNGVILVNLKKGTKDGSIHTTYSMAYTLNKAKKELDVLTAEQYRAYRIPIYPLSDLGSSTDWFDAVTRLGQVKMHTLTISGGNSKTNYRATVDYRNANGIDLRSDRKEYGARVSLNHTTKDGLFTFAANVAPRKIVRNKAANVYQSTLGINPTAPVYDENETSGYYRFPAGSGFNNIVEQLNLEQSNTEIDVIEWNATAGINILPLFSPKNPDLSLKSQVTVSEFIYDKFNAWFTPSYYGPNVNSGVTGKASRNFDRSDAINLEWITNFSAKIKDHNIRAMAGYSYSYGMSEGLSGENWNFNSDVLTYNDLGSGLYAAEDGRIMLDSYKNDHKLISFFGRINYDWKQRYMLTLSLRHEGSSRFGANHKWGNFPAVSVGWRLSDEPFMKNVSFIDDLKFRYDFGITGNESIGNYNSLATYSSFGTYTYLGQTIVTWGVGKNVNPELRWEKGYNQNLGLDFSLFNYRVSGSLNFYNRHQVDLLGSYEVPTPPNVYTTVYANVGSLRNKGFEFDLTVEAIRNKEFTWSMTVVGATNDNKFESFSNDLYKGSTYYSVCNMSNPNNPGYLQRIEEGKRVGNYYTWRYAGVDEDGDWLVYDKNNEIISHANATEEDKAITGNGLPLFTGSFTSEFTYKNFDLSFSLSTALGFDIFNVHNFYYGLQSGTGNILTTAYAKNALITKGSNVLLDYFLEKGDYLKLDNVTLGYNLNLQRRFIDRIRVYATANNLGTLTRFTGIDPSTYEYNGLTPGTFGGSYNYYPSAFQFIFGLQVQF